MYGWEGLRRVIPLKGESSVTVSGLALEQTYMFVTGRKDARPEIIPSDVTEKSRAGASWNFSHGPLKVSENKRFLVHEDDAPFFWLGDTAWELFHRLNRKETVKYLEKRREQGFTVIQAVVLAELDGLNTPNANGDRPLIDNDPAMPNKSYIYGNRSI